MKGNVSTEAVGRELAEEHPTGQLLMDVTPYRLLSVNCDCSSERSLVSYLFHLVGERA